MSSSILDVSPKEQLPNFLKFVESVGDINLDRIYTIANKTIRYLGSGQHDRQRLRLDQALEQRWYASLATGAPDWGVYDTDEYLAELWACWIVYSRRYLLAICSRTGMVNHSIVADIGRVERVVDLGCGFGYTTGALKGIYPGAAVIGTNLEGIQTEIARKVGRRYGFTVVPEIGGIGGPVDLVFASEYFEHIPQPVDHLLDVLHTLQPRVLLVANTFGQKAVGHFDAYRVDGKLLAGRDTSRRFNQVLVDHGYKKMQTKLWNNRPAYWKKQDAR